GVPRVQRGYAVQDDSEAESEGAAETADATGRGVSEVRQAAAAAQWAVWRVHQLQRISEVQVHQAGTARCEVPQGWRRYCRAEDQARRCVLWMRELSEVRFCFESEAGG